MKTNVLIILLFTILTSCSNLKKVIESPKIKLKDVQVKNLGGKEAELYVILSVQNPNNIDFDVKNVNYTLDINSKKVTSGTLKEKVLVKAKETTIVTLPLMIKYTDIISSVFLLMKKEGLPYKVQGSAEIGPFTIPFDKDGSLDTSDL